VKPLFLALLFIPIAALAQEQEAQREVLRRDQQSDAFGQRLRQALELQHTPPERRQEVESRQLQERQRLENASERQLRDVKADAPAEARAHERQKAAQERRALP